MGMLIPVSRGCLPSWTLTTRSLLGVEKICKATAWALASVNGDPLTDQPHPGAASIISVYHSCYYCWCYSKSRTSPMQSVYSIFFFLCNTVGNRLFLFWFWLALNKRSVFALEGIHYPLFSLIVNIRIKFAGRLFFVNLSTSLSFMYAGDSPWAEAQQRWAAGLFVKRVLGDSWTHPTFSFYL